MFLMRLTVKLWVAVTQTRIIQMSAIFEKKIFDKQKICFYSTSQERNTLIVVRLWCVSWLCSLNTQKETNLQTTSVYLTYFEWILMKYIGEIKDMYKHMVENAVGPRMVHLSGKAIIICFKNMSHLLKIPITSPQTTTMDLILSFLFRYNILQQAGNP